MSIVLDGTAGITTPDVESSGPVSGTNFSYTGTLTGGTGVVNLGSGQVYKDASGNVGIGTSSPSASDWNASATVVQSSKNDTNGGLFKASSSNTNFIFSAGNDLAYLATTTNTPITFYTNTTERMRIDSSGNLLVGTTSAIVSGVNGVQINGAGNTIFSRSSTGQQYQISFFNPNGSVGRIETNGSSTSYVTSSDYRLKENIAPMTGALSVVQALKPCTYTWKADGSDGQGFIAHELQAVVPDCVTGEKDAVDAEGNPQYQGIDTSFLVATLTAAIQEQQALINAQQAALESLTARVVALDARLTSLEGQPT